MFAQRGQFCFRSFSPFPNAVVIRVFCADAVIVHALLRQRNYLVARYLLGFVQMLQCEQLVFLFPVLGFTIRRWFCLRVLLRLLVCFRSFLRRIVAAFPVRLRFRIKVRICVVIRQIGKVDVVPVVSGFLRLQCEFFVHVLLLPPLWSAGKYVCLFQAAGLPLFYCFQGCVPVSLIARWSCEYPPPVGISSGMPVSAIVPP